MKAGSNAFDTTLFVERLFAFMGGRAGVPVVRESEGSDAEIEDDDPDIPLQWGKIGQLALAKSRRVPAMDFMYISVFFMYLKGLMWSPSGLVHCQ